MENLESIITIVYRTLKVMRFLIMRNRLLNGFSLSNYVHDSGEFVETVLSAAGNL